MYNNHRGGGFGEAVLWGAGLFLGWYLMGLVITGCIMAVTGFWMWTSTFKPAGRKISRGILIALAVVFVFFILAALGNS